MKHHRFCYFRRGLRGKKPNYLRLPILEDQRDIQVAITKVRQGSAMEVSITSEVLPSSTDCR
jgi:hypothetical protein